MSARRISSVRIPEIMRADVQVRADTIDEGARTVEIVWAAGAPVQRYDWREREDYVEELSMNPAHIRMTRFAAGMSLLDSHNPYSMDDRLGVVIPGSVRIENGLGIATVQFSRKQRAEELFQDVRDGMPFPVSVGYRTHAYERTEASDTSIARLTATDWEPMELSAVPIPADPAAHSRSEEAGTSHLLDIPVADRPQNRNPRMPQPNRTGRRTAFDTNHDRLTEEEHNDGAPSRATREAQMARTYPKSDAVRAFVTQTGREDIDVELFVAQTRGMNELEIRSAFLDAVVTRQEQAPTFPHGAERTTAADRRSEIELRGEAIFARAVPSHKLPERGQRFAHMSFAEHARDCLRAAGENVVGLSGAQIVTRALHTTSDFPIIVGVAGKLAVRAGYEAEDSDIQETARLTTLNDFKIRRSVDISAAPKLLLVNEHGEYKRGTFKEGAEGYGLSTYGRIAGMTRQLLINDDLSMLDRVMPKMGQAARDFELSSLVALIEANPQMADGYEVFSAQHKNLGTGAALSVEALSAARLAMRRQTGLAGEAIGVRPKFLVVPAELETVGEQVLAQIAATKTNDTNPFAGRLTLIVEHRLQDPKAWYVSAATSQIDGIEYAHLAGQEGPHFETRAGWDIDGIEIKIRLDFGAGWIDHRGWFKNPGV